ncbi:MAG: cysteine desulfurase [Planctomycetes bacterium]|nr:cysteine desulfurase [Planctomycetota bacterium]MBI3848342.1 cysteine desulfurase [Planctomycetota bacterium]
MTPRIYLDHAATTPVRPEVEAFMQPFHRTRFGNASSLHEEGRLAREAIEDARLRVARALGAGGDEVVFTSGGTEADNLALFGVAWSPRAKSRHVVTTTIEHHAVLNTVSALREDGFETRFVPVDRGGRVRFDELEAALRPDTAIVSVMWANNEVGAIQPIAEIGALCRDRGVLFHTDAVQAFGKVAIDFRSLPVDLLSVSAHKIGGPKGAGALVARRSLKLRPMLFGGQHEFGRRAGTENVAAIAGFGCAAESCAREVAEHSAHLASLGRAFVDALRAAVPGVHVHSPDEGVALGIVNVAFEGAAGEAIVLQLDRLGIATSPGSACTSTVENSKPSHVLVAMGVPAHEARGSVRFSFGSENSAGEIPRTVSAVKQAVERLRGVSRVG